MTFSRLDAHRPLNLHFQDRFGVGLGSLSLDVAGEHLVFDGFKVRLIGTGAFLYQQFKRTLCCLELVALILFRNDLGQDLVLCGPSAGKPESCIKAAMLERPDSSLTRMRRSFPILVGSICS